MKVFIYSRISTVKQSYVRQTEELSDYAKSQNYEVVGVYEEVISGFKKNVDRPELSRMITDLKENGIKKVLVWEISRLGRTVDQVSSTITRFNEMGISLFIKMNNIETLINGKVNPMTTFMINILLSVSEMEKNIIMERMNSGRKAYVKNGGRLGRPDNTKMKKEEVLSKHSDIVKFLKGGQSIRNTAKLTSKGISTVQRVKGLL